jgi:hypothetical protein
MRYKKVKKYDVKDIQEDKCFNKNKNVAVRCLELRDKYNISTAVETGTFMAHTTVFLAEAFDNVYTIDIFKEFTKKAEERVKGKNVKCLFGKSVEVLKDVCQQLDKNQNILFFLDAHGNYINDIIKLGLQKDMGQSKKYYTEEFNTDLCPAKLEIEVISKYFYNKCIIIVDDIYNPYQMDSGHINFGGIRFDYSYLREAIEKCYDDHKIDYICGKGLGWPKSVLIIEPQ